MELGTSRSLLIALGVVTLLSLVVLTGPQGTASLAQTVVRYGVTFNSTPPIAGDPNSYVALCLLVKNEHFNIREWVLHHYSIGIHRLYIFDDGSTPPLQRVLQDFIDAGLVDYQFIFEQLRPKDPTLYPKHMLAIYEMCLEKARAANVFAGFIDSDEYIMLRNSSDTIDTLLRDFEGYGGLVVNWIMYGSSSNLVRPEAGVLAGYTSCVPMASAKNTHVKSIVRTAVARVAEYHHFKYSDGFYAVNSAFHPVHGPFSAPANHERVALHHYVTRSVEDFQIKQRRGLPGDGVTVERNFDFFFNIDSITNETCLGGVPVGQALYARYGDLLNAPRTAAH